MNKGLKVALTVLMAGALIIPTVNASTPEKESIMVNQQETIVVPDKIEYTKTASGAPVEVVYIDDPAKADLYLEQQGIDTSVRNQQKSKSSEIGTMAKYKYLGKTGYKKHQFKVDYMENRGVKAMPWTKKISRKSTTEITASVSSEFHKFFKSTVGITLTNEELYEDTFVIEIPVGKQGEIWSWNVAEAYRFSKNGDLVFEVLRPTASFGHTTLVTDFRNPHGD